MEMKRLLHRAFGVMLLAAACAGMAFAQEAAPAGEGTGEIRLEKVVVVSRHGVRAPTQSREKLEEWSSRKWPQWPVSRSHLTPRGSWLVTMQWSRMGEWLRQKSLLSGACPSQDDFYVYADTDQRTRHTAMAMLEGIAPQCGIEFMYAREKKDPLFHPVKEHVCALDEQSVRRDVRLESGGLESLARELAPGVRLASEVAGPEGMKLCGRYQLANPCFISDIPSKLVVDPAKGAEIEGGLDIAGSLAEIWLLEYAQWPDRQPAWDLGGPDLLETVLPVHMKVFNAVNRAEAVARSQGSMLAARVIDALEGVGEEKAARARFVAFVGHDTNLSNLGGLMGLSWDQPGYVVNQTPPGGALMFTLWRMPGGGKRLGMQYVSLSLEGLRSQTPEEAREHLLVTPVTWDYCLAARGDDPEEKSAHEAPGEDSFMPILHSPDAFFEAVRGALQTKCLGDPDEAVVMKRE